jgi:D-alanine transaminase
MRSDAPAALQIRLQERPFNTKETPSGGRADAFVTASSQFGKPVAAIDVRTIEDSKSGNITRRLRQEFHIFRTFSRGLPPSLAQGSAN